MARSSGQQLVPWLGRLRRPRGGSPSIYCSEPRAGPQARALPLPGLTAWQIPRFTALVGAGDRALVHTAGGGVRHLEVQIATYLGANVSGTASGSHHPASTGAGHRLGRGLPHTWFEEVIGGVDVVVDLIGNDLS